ncbi:MAG TPA: GWxTD domain-containing protein [Thermoanaerobaculaceae bacterium]|nr:GWxTD domain-containing protein [Thermoanaerobaculaceae bacterium]
MRRRITTLALVALLLGTFAGAELSQQYKDWPNGPAGFLLTSSERKAYAEIKTDAEAQAFIDLFFAKRDEKLGAVNEFKLNFDERVKAADKQFATDKLAGSMTDRGKVLILMGPPVGPARNAPAGQGQEGNLPDFMERGASQTWIYTKDGKPAVKKEDEIPFVFWEMRPGTKDYVLEKADRRNRQALKLLAEQPEKLVLHPKLTEVPRPGLLPGSKAATSEELKVFDGAAKLPEGAKFVTASGLQSDVLHPIWVWLQLPDSTPAAAHAICRVRRADTGAVVGSFGSVAVTPVSVPGARAYEFSLPVQDAGKWKVDLALLGDAGPVAVTTLDATNEATPADGPYVAPLLWGADVRQEAQAHLGDAFNVGGWHVIPRLDNKYTPEESLAYFGSVVRPTLDAQGNPKVEISMVLYANGKKNDESGFTAANVSKVGNTNIWMFGSSLPLSGFRRGVDFELELTVRDSLANVARSVKIPFTIPKVAAAAPAGTAAPAAASPAPAPKQ